MAKLKYKKRIVPDAGRHLCTLVSTEEVENKFYDPKKDKEDMAKRLEWVFAYDKKPDMQIRTWSSFNISIWKGKKSKALTIIETLLEKELSEKEKEKFDDTDSLLGKKCYLTVKHEKHDDGQTYAKIIDFEKASSTPF